MSRSRVGVRERLYGWIAGKLIVKAGKLAFKRGDMHEYEHALAALNAGDSESCRREP